jgi:hypothetical protein
MNSHKEIIVDGYAEWVRNISATHQHIPMGGIIIFNQENILSTRFNSCFALILVNLDTHNSLVSHVDYETHSRFRDSFNPSIQAFADDPGEKLGVIIYGQESHVAPIDLPSITWLPKIKIDAKFWHLQFEAESRKIVLTKEFCTKGEELETSTHHCFPAKDYERFKPYSNWKPLKERFAEQPSLESIKVLIQNLHNAFAAVDLEQVKKIIESSEGEKICKHTKNILTVKEGLGCLIYEGVGYLPSDIEEKRKRYAILYYFKESSLIKHNDKSLMICMVGFLTVGRFALEESRDSDFAKLCHDQAAELASKISAEAKLKNPYPLENLARLNQTINAIKLVEEQTYALAPQLLFQPNNPSDDSVLVTAPAKPPATHPHA